MKNHLISFTVGCEMEAIFKQYTGCLSSIALLTYDVNVIDVINKQKLVI